MATLERKGKFILVAGSTVAGQLLLDDKAKKVDTGRSSDGSLK